MRAIATTGKEAPALWSRNGNPVSESFPEVGDALAAVLDHRETVLDGEIVALDEVFRPSPGYGAECTSAHPPPNYETVP